MSLNKTKLKIKFCCNEGIHLYIEAICLFGTRMETRMEGWRVEDCVQGVRDYIEIYALVL